MITNNLLCACLLLLVPWIAWSQLVDGIILMLCAMKLDHWVGCSTEYYFCSAAFPNVYWKPVHFLSHYSRFRSRSFSQLLIALRGKMTAAARQALETQNASLHLGLTTFLLKHAQKFLGDKPSHHFRLFVFYIRVRVWGAGLHLPTQGYVTYPPPPPPWEWAIHTQKKHLINQAQFYRER